MIYLPNWDIFEGDRWHRPSGIHKREVYTWILPTNWYMLTFYLKSWSMLIGVGWCYCWCSLGKIQHKHTCSWTMLCLLTRSSEGDCTPWGTVECLKRLLRRVYYWTWGCVRWFWRTFKEVGLCSWLGTFRKSKQFYDLLNNLNNFICKVGGGTKWSYGWNW